MDTRQDDQLGTGKTCKLTIGQAVKDGLVDNETLGYFMARTQLFMELVSLSTVSCGIAWESSVRSVCICVSLLERTAKMQVCSPQIPKSELCAFSSPLPRSLVCNIAPRGQIGSLQHGAVNFA